MKSGQMDFELKSFIKFLQDNRASSYLEIGARYGDTFFDVMRALPIGSKGVCVDMPGHLWGTGGSQDHLKAACQELQDMGYEITLILGDSTHNETVEAVHSMGYFDAALIDGDHRYDGVKADFNNYSGICDFVAFHDIVGHGQRHSEGIDVEVPRFWSEIKHKGCIEFIAKDSKMGIGVWTI